MEMRLVTKERATSFNRKGINRYPNIFANIIFNVS